MKKLSFLFALLCASVMAFATVYDETELVLDAGETSNQTITLSICKSGANTTQVVAKSTTSVFTGVYECIWQQFGGGTTPEIGEYTVTDHEISFETTWATYPTSATQLRFVARRNNTGGGSDIFGGTATSAEVTGECAGSGSGDKTASNLALNETAKTLDAAVPETFQIVATTAQGYDGTVTYSSNKEGIATVSATGLVTAVGRGTATITVTAPETDNFAASTKKLTVTVTGPINWAGVDWLTNSTQYKVVVDPEIGSQFGGIKKDGDNLFIGFPSAAFGAMSIEPNGGENAAWRTFALSNFPLIENQFTVVCQNVTYTFDVYNKDGKDVIEIYDTNFALASNGASAIASSGTAANAIDGNEETRWESAQKPEKDEETPIPENIEYNNNQNWTLDMGQLRIYSLVRIVWEGAYGKSFDIESSRDGENWKTVKEIRDQSLSGFPHVQDIELAQNDTARYIRFKGIARGSQYGYSFYEFLVLLPGNNILTSIDLSASAGYAKVGTGLTLTAQAKNQLDAPMEVEISFEVTPEDAGSVVDGVYTPAKAGAASIIAKSGEVQSEAVVVYGVTSDNIALNKTVVAGYTPGNAAEAPSKVVDGINNTQWTTWQAQPASKEWLYVDLGARYNLEGIDILWGNDHSTNYILQVRTDAPSAEQAEDDEAWTTVATVTTATRNSEVFSESTAEKVQYVRIHSLARINNDLIRLNEFRIFGTEWVAEGDTKAPVMVSAEVDSKTYNSVVLAVSASDEDGEVVKYRVVETAHEINVQLAPIDGKITVTGLEAETDYTFVVTAIDGADHESTNNVEVEATTGIDTSIPLVAAPAPKQKAENVRPIYSDAYTSILEHSFALSNWGSVAGAEKAIDDNHYLLYNMTAGNAVIWGENNAGGNAIVAKEGYNAGGTGDNTGVDASAMDSLHMDIFSLVAMSNIEVRINDNLVRKISLTNEGWQQIDIALADPVEALNTTSVRWFKITNIVDANRQKLAFDNIFFYKKDSTTPTALDNTVEAVKVQKMIENGQLIIIKNGIRYNVAGQMVK